MLDRVPEPQLAAPIRGQVRRTGYRRLSHGLYLPERPEPEDDRFFANLRAWQLVLPEDGVFTGLTAARLGEWWLPLLPAYVPVFAATCSDRTRTRRPELVVSRLRREPRPSIVRGLPVDAAEEVLLRAARDLGLLDLVVLMSSALRLGQVTAAGIDAVAASGRHGSRPLRLAASMAEPRCESAWEVILMLFHVLVGVEVEPQVPVHHDGRFLGRADLLIRGTTFVQEFDGAHHREREQQTADRRRDRGFAGTPYERRGYTADDLLSHGLVVLAELDQMLGRRHRPERLARWRRWVALSSYSAQGRVRLQHRWWRLHGPGEWS